jgi:pyroglutamyl-peptidase
VSRHVLLTGFEPFGSQPIDPSEMLVRSVEGRVIRGRAIAVRIFPAETRTLRNRLEAALAEERPEIVIGTGYAPGAAALSLERAALNVLDIDPDAVGTTRKNEMVQTGGPDARLTTLPLAEILGAWDAVGVPGYVSHSAGTGLCNQWLYEALALTAGSEPPVPAGLIRLPALPAQAVQLGAERTPSMTLELMRRGLETALETLAMWLERQPAAPARPASGQVWIPRGLRQLER